MIAGEIVCAFSSITIDGGIVYWLSMYDCMWNYGSFQWFIMTEAGSVCLFSSIY